MKLIDNRVDASQLTEQERGLLQPLLDLAQRDQHPCLKGADGTEVPLPDPIFSVLVKVIQEVRHGKAVVLMPADETFTTQAAANLLGMSRQYFVTLLESGEIPFHRVGSHRRVHFKDLREYAAKRDAKRRAGLKHLFDEVNKAGLYEANYSGQE